MNDLVYTRILSDKDIDIPYLLKIYQLPDVSRFINISDNYFHYVTNTENVCFFKIYENKKLIGATHLEKCEDLLFMDILIFPEYQKMGFATRVIKDIQNDIFGLDCKRIEISIDESNIASIKLFENAGFTLVSKEDELLNYVYNNADTGKHTMEELILIRPTGEYASQIAEYRQEFLDAGNSMDGCGPLRRIEKPKEYIKTCAEYEDKQTVPSHLVPATQLFLIRKSDNKLVGMLQVRHCFNDYLEKYAGHIGYSIRPSERRK